MRDNIGLRILGDQTRLSQPLQQLIRETDELSKKTNGLRVNVCLNYGGRDEITRAARSLAIDAAAGKLDPASITPELLASRLDTAGLPDPDLIIRTGAEKRLSNYLLWQSAYAELFFTDTLWPDFTVEELNRAFDWYASRQRRFGGV